MNEIWTKTKNALLWVADTTYRIVCGSLECPYCTFYRGVVFGAVTVAALWVAAALVC